jgi:PAS domain S-box-containing protein
VVVVALGAVSLNALLVVLGIGTWLARSARARAVIARRMCGVVIAVAAIAAAFLGRLASASALIFVLLGVALVLEDQRRAARFSWPAALLGALIALFGARYGESPGYVVAFVLAACAILTARPATGITGLLISDTDAGHLMRRLLPTIVLVDVVTGWLQVRFGVPLMVLAATVALAVFTSVTAASLRRSELKRREVEQSLAVDVASITSLNKVATQFFPETAPLANLLSEIVDAAITISGASYGALQILDPTSGDLQIVAQRGFPDWWLAFWNSVSRGQGASGTALERGERVVVEDIEQSSIYRGRALEMQRKAGVRAVQSTPLFTRSGEPVGMVSTAYTRPHRLEDRRLRYLDLLARQAADIIERARTDARLRTTQEQLRLAQRVARIGTFEWKANTGLEWTPELERMYGLPFDGIARTSDSWAALIHPDDRAGALKRVEEAFATGSPTEGEWRVRWPDGSLHWLSGRFQAFQDEEGQPSHVIGVNIEITELKRAEHRQARMLAEIRDLTKNLEAKVAERTREVAVACDRLDGIIAMAADAIISIDDNRRITIFNRAAEQIFGWKREEVLGKPLEVLMPGGLRATHGMRKNGELFPAEATISRLQTEITVILRDITDRKRIDDEQARVYAERALLLKEIHHRVKNNLQVISSLFYLQAQRTDLEPVRRLLDESRARVKSIAIIHEKLYQSEHFATVDFGDYLRDLTASLASAIGIQAPNVRIHVDAEPILLDIDRAIPCGLIANELVSNSLRHAFPDGRRGDIYIGVHEIESEVHLEVSDTGVGLPPEVDFKTVTTLGLQLVVSLTNQLHGTLELGRGLGTGFRIRFPVSPPVRRADSASHTH